MREYLLYSTTNFSYRRVLAYVLLSASFHRVAAVFLPGGVGCGCLSGIKKRVGGITQCK